MLAAVAVDVLFGEPPTALHPTGWMGTAIGGARRRHARRPRPPAASLVAGALALGTGVAGVALVARAADAGASRRGARARAALGGSLLKPALSLRALLGAALDVERALRRGDVPEARRLLAWHLVSRDTSTLTSSEVAGAAIESLAENLSDGLVAPLVWYAVGGLPAAYAYRFVNTADAMLGYRTPELEWFGKSAARLDDAMNLVPARLAAACIALAAPAAGGSARAARRVALADARRTPSPNAGWPMAAMAGALGVRLDKRASRGAEPVYVLHESGRAPTVRDLANARGVVMAASGLAVACLAGAASVRARRGAPRGRPA